MQFLRQEMIAESIGGLDTDPDQPMNHLLENSHWRDRVNCLYVGRRRGLIWRQCFNMLATRCVCLNFCYA
jgi:hypothetical protein